MNPFIHSMLFEGRRRELHQVEQHVGRGESVLLIGGRRFGKTRLLAQVQAPGRTLYRMDAQAWELSTEQQAIADIGLALGSPCAHRRDLEACLRGRAPYCILIDEADRLLMQPWAPSFMAFLRAIDGGGSNGLGRSSAFVLAGGPTLLGWRNKADNESPPLNISEPVLLEALDDQASERLIAMAGKPGWGPVIMVAAAGHPWLLERILREVFDGRPLQHALDAAFDHCADTFGVWWRQLGPAGRALVEALPPKGASAEEFRPRGALARHRPARRMAHATGLLRPQYAPDDTVARWQSGPGMFTDWRLSQPDAPAWEWDLAISFASEDEGVARQIKRSLGSDHRIFLAHDESDSLWGEDLYHVLPHVFGVAARYVLVLSSTAYVTKHWTRVEFEAVLAGFAGRLLVIAMGALPPDLPPGNLYKDIRDPTQAVTIIPDLKKKLSASAPPSP